MTVKMIAFTCCGHCPMAIVKLHGKCRPMDVFCPLQEDEEGRAKLVYSSQLLAKVGETCPLPDVEQWMAKLSLGLTDEQLHEFVRKTRFFSCGLHWPEQVAYSQEAFKTPVQTVMKEV